MQNQKLRLMTTTGVFTALIFVFTAFIHIPSYTGYVHIGDGFLFLAAAMLPTPYAMFAGAAGAALADILTGYAIWAPASVIIKAVTVLFFSSLSARILTKRNFLAIIPSAMLCIGGYYLYEGIIYGSFLAPLYGVPGNLTQAVFSGVVFAIAGLALDKMNIKSKIYLSTKTAGRKA